MTDIFIPIIAAGPCKNHFDDGTSYCGQCKHRKPKSEFVKADKILKSCQPCRTSKEKFSNARPRKTSRRVKNRHDGFNAEDEQEGVGSSVALPDLDTENEKTAEGVVDRGVMGEEEDHGEGVHSGSRTTLARIAGVNGGNGEIDLGSDGELMTGRPQRAKRRQKREELSEQSKILCRQSTKRYNESLLKDTQLPKNDVTSNEEHA